METIEKYGINLFDEFTVKLDYVKRNFEKNNGKEIKLLNIRHSPSIKLSSNKYEVFNVEVNCWQVLNGSKLVGQIFSMLDKFGNYYYIDVSNEV